MAVTLRREKNSYLLCPDPVLEAKTPEINDMALGEMINSIYNPECHEL